MLTTLLQALYTKLYSFLSDIFSTVFGSWNYGVLFQFFPADIGLAAGSVILVLFCLAVLRVLRDFLPF